MIIKTDFYAILAIPPLAPFDQKFEVESGI